MMIGLVVAFLGLGVPSLEHGGSITSVQMGYISGMGGYMQVDRTSRMAFGNHTLELGVGWFRLSGENTLYLRGRWDYVRPGFQMTVMGSMPLLREEFPRLSP